MIVLRVEVAYSPKGYLLSQSKYVTNILEGAKFNDNKNINTFIETNAKYYSFDGVPLSDPILYRTIIRSLVHLTIILPDIAYVHVVS